MSFLGVDCELESLALSLLPQIYSGDQGQWRAAGLALHAQQTHSSKDNSLVWVTDTFHYFFLKVEVLLMTYEPMYTYIHNVK